MLCKNFDSLSHYEKITYIGELLHSCQSDNYFFELGMDIINSAKDVGLFEGVVILPQVTDQVEEQIEENQNQ
jgi:hypothetical protein